ncbi:MAG: meromycolate extension acyl carrier protein [Isosphaeraceae bacterium]|jgi:acyl carrier protein|nr:MAG: meromycolate extension acyl carrier protein [Isosphaeraceae bacterium]
MTERNRLSELAALTRQVAKLSPTTLIAAESRFVEDLGVDSLDLVALVLEVQERFGVTIDEDQIGSLRTVGDLLRLISEAPELRAA